MEIFLAVQDDIFCKKGTFAVKDNHFSELCWFFFLETATYQPWSW